MNNVQCSTHYFNIHRISDYHKFSKELQIELNKIANTSRPVIFLCIGTDRATGDCLGPLTGYQLSSKITKKAIIYGTLNHPVHAKNLKSIISEIKLLYSNPYIIAIDASLGTHEHVGYVTLSKQTLKPGIGVNKSLPEIGELCITGIVGMLTHNNHATLQGTRLSLVVQLSKFISNGILRCYDETPAPLVKDYLMIY